MRRVSRLDVRPGDHLIVAGAAGKRSIPFAAAAAVAIAGAMSAEPHLDELNPAQRAAVLHGLPEAGPLPPGPPLLIIAGAGSGKTATLAHRVAHLVLKGADPGRLLLLTFTRRAAEAMVRRAERICGQALGSDAAFAGRLEWAGTFHGIGARLLRHYADAIGLDPGFTILDRGDAADLIDLVRDELALSRTDRRFPQKGTCLAIYSYAVNAQAPLDRVLQDGFPWCAEWAAELKRLFGAYVDAKQRQGVLDYDDLLLWWEQMVAVPEVAADLGAPVRLRPGRRVPGHQRHPGCDPAADQARRARASPWSATTRRRSTPSGPPRCATSWTSRTASRRRPGSWRSSRTTARPSRSWPPPTP